MYEGNTTKVTDPAGKWKKHTTDAMGNLVQVTEPDPGGGANHEAYYTYNLVNQLTLVSMPRGSFTQTRTFVYNSDLRLASATNPENGTVTYTYNSDGTLQKKTDAKGQRIEYTYDSYKRVTGIAHYNAQGQGTEGVSYYYDQNPFEPGYSENVWGRLAAAQYNYSTEMYSYTPAGLATKKRLHVSVWWSATNLDLEAAYTYDNEGRVVTLAYPAGGSTYTYGYDSLGRPNSLTTPGYYGEPFGVVSGVVYGPAGELKQMNWYGGYTVAFNETRTYNSRLQLTRQTVQGVSGGGPWATDVDLEYRYSATQNNGQITQLKDWVTGEEVNYTYDSLSRLSAASTTGPEWGQSYGYDGFGNRTSVTVTKGTAPAGNLSYDGMTNHITNSGFTYDANGNLTAMPGQSVMSYDVGNRLVQVVNQQYGYAPDNRRIWQYRGIDYGTEVYFYGVDGRKLGLYRMLEGGSTAILDENVYFAGRLIMGSGTLVAQDRLGSVRARRWGLGFVERPGYFPWGEERTTTAQNRDKFGTYYRDQTGLDYADQRYYSSQHGRFLTPDPYSSSGGLRDPQSWNRYAYVENDPVNYADPGGLLRRCPAGTSSTGWTCIADDVIGVEYEPTRYYYGPELIAGGGGGRDGGGSRDTPAALEEWEALNADCRSGLEAAMSVNADTGAEVAARLRLNALARAGGQTGVLAAAAAASDPIDWTMLGAIGIRESGFANVLQSGGNGAGVFQIDLGENSEVDVTDARNLAWAAKWAANRLATNYAKLAAAHPNLDPAHLLQATAASYNLGTGGISGNPDTIDVGSPGNNYGSNIMNLMRCFH